MKVAQLPVETMNQVMNLLAEFPYKTVAPVLTAVQQQVRLVDVDPPSFAPPALEPPPAA